MKTCDSNYGYARRAESHHQRARAVANALATAIKDRIEPPGGALRTETISQIDAYDRLTLTVSAATAKRLGSTAATVQQKATRKGISFRRGTRPSKKA